VIQVGVANDSLGRGQVDQAFNRLQTASVKAIGVLLDPRDFRLSATLTTEGERGSAQQNLHAFQHRQTGHGYFVTEAGQLSSPALLQERREKADRALGHLDSPQRSLLLRQASLTNEATLTNQSTDSSRKGYNLD
jgi:hypothetical protein